MKVCKTITATETDGTEMLRSSHFTVTYLEVELIEVWEECVITIIQIS